MQEAQQSRRQMEFAAAVNEHGRSMFRAARAIADCDADAEDAVGEAVLRAWQAYPRLRRREAVRAWLVKITVNCAYEQYRKTGREQASETLEGLAEVAEEDRRYEDLWEAVSALPRDLRVTVVLYYYEDMDVKGIANALGVAQGTVKSRLSRARERLRVWLSEEEEG